MYCLITDNGAPPTVDTKYEFVHSVGSRERSQPNSCRSTREVRPLICLTALWTPNCGSTSMSKCTWSGMISISMTSIWYSLQISSMSSFKRTSTPLTKTLRRYFGHQTTWYLQEYTTLWLLLYSMTTLYHSTVSNASRAKSLCGGARCGLYPHA